MSGWRVGPRELQRRRRREGREADVRDRLREFARVTGDKRHEPAPLLDQLAAEGRGFGSLTKA